jgi:hypothetical protein
MKPTLIFIRNQMVPTFSFGLFVAAEGAFLYGLYKAFVGP